MFCRYPSIYAYPLILAIFFQRILSLWFNFDGFKNCKNCLSSSLCQGKVRWPHPYCPNYRFHRNDNFFAAGILSFTPYGNCDGRDGVMMLVSQLNKILHIPNLTYPAITDADLYPYMGIIYYLFGRGRAYIYAKILFMWRRGTYIYIYAI